MVEIEATPGMLGGIYQRMERNLAVVRRRLDRPLTLAEKVLLGHLDDPDAGEQGGDGQKGIRRARCLS